MFALVILKSVKKKEGLVATQGRKGKQIDTYEEVKKELSCVQQDKDEVSHQRAKTVKMKE